MLRSSTPRAVPPPAAANDSLGLPDQRRTTLGPKVCRTDADVRRRSGARRYTDRVDRAVDVGLGRGPVADADPHRRLAVPRGTAHPGIAAGLDALDDPSGVRVVVSEAYEHLVEDHVVEDTSLRDRCDPVRAPRRQPAA